MSELVLNDGECKDPQSLFTEYDQRYFGGRLPRYKVLLTSVLNPDCGRCERRKRRIYINPDKEDVSVILLHEMVHAAVGRGHEKIWRDEVRQLVELDAPPQEDLKRSATENGVAWDQLLSEFFEAGKYAPPDWTWPEIRWHIEYNSGIKDNHGRAIGRRWSLFLRNARRELYRGQAKAHP